MGLGVVAKEPASRLLDGSRRAEDGACHGCWALVRASRAHPESIHQSRCPPTTVRDAAAKRADQNIPIGTYILLTSVGDSFATSRATSSTGCELCIAGMCLWDCFADHVNETSKLKKHGLKILAYSVM